MRNYLIFSLIGACLTLFCACEPGGDILFAASPQTLDFGAVPLQTGKTLSILVEHAGTGGSLVVSDIQLEGLSEDDFTISVGDTSPQAWTPDSRIALGAGEYETINITYTPSGAAGASGNVVFTHNVASQGFQTKVPVTTGGLAADLVCNPSPIDFGTVEGGTSKTMDVVITNNGTVAADVQDIYLDYLGSLDFSIIDVVSGAAEQADTTLAPGESMSLVLEYTPTGGGDDSSSLTISGAVGADERQWTCDIMGTETGPKINVLPVQMDFGAVAIDETKTLSFTVSNMGNADLYVTGIALVTGSDEGLTIDDGPTAWEPVVLAPEEFREFHVTWAPAAIPANPDDPIGTITIASTDATSPTLVPVYGGVDAPLIEVLPAQVDFGFCAQNTPKMASLTISNNGSAPLVISSLTIADESTTEYGKQFEIVYDSTFPVTSPTSPVESTIAANSFQAVKLTFTARGPESGNQTATLVIVSNARGQERIEVPLKAYPTVGGDCRAQLVPSTTSFGTVAIGFPKTAEVRLVNTGTGFCTVKLFKLADCTTDIMGTTSCPAPLTGSPSTYFTIKTPPSTANNALAPGSSMSIQIEFTPAFSTDLFGLVDNFSALLSFKIHDSTQNLDYLIPKCDAAGCQPNINGKAVISKATVLPDQIDFGTSTIGCGSTGESVCIYSSGSGPLTITGIELDGCSAEFKMNGLPTMPATVESDTPVCFQTKYTSVTEGLDACSIQISVTDSQTPVITIPITGEGTFETLHTDSFTQPAGNKVDVLFVIDDSGSMCEEQQRLVDAFDQFISRAQVWGNDYHIGVINVDATDQAVIGRLNRGDSTITPRYVTSNPDVQAQLERLGNIGCDGASAEEAGLQAAQAALTAPLTTDTGVECDSDADCTGDANICPGPTACPYTCIEGTCGGFNKGFLREDAQLEIVVLSDEEDQSVGTVDFYLEFLTNLKGQANAGRVHFNSIVGVAGVPAGDVEGECVASDGATAIEGARYIAVTTGTDGLYGSICESSFASIMQDISAVAFNPNTHFFLSRQADPATIKVKINNAFCYDDWEFDALSNAVIFDTEGACMPTAGEKVDVSYKMLCLNN